MNFEDVIQNLANKNAISRSSNIGKEFRGQVSKEGLLSQKKLFINDSRICEEFCRFDENFDFRRLLLYMILTKENYTIDADLSSLEKEVKELRKTLLETDKYIHWKTKDKEVYETVLDAILEDKKVSNDEWNVINKLQTKLNINIYKHWILRIKKDLFDEVNKTSTLTDDKLTTYLRELERGGLLFLIEKEGKKYIIPEEIASKLKNIYGVEIQDYKFEELLNNYLVTKKDKTTFLKKYGIDGKGSNDILNKTIISNNLKPSDFLDSLNSKALSKWANKLSIKQSGTKEQKIKRIISHYNEMYLPEIKPKDERETYYKFYEELANRRQSDLIKKSVVKKGEEIGAKFEEATRYLFEKKLGYKLQNPTIKGRKQGVKADGKAVIGNDYIIWDCKTKDKDFTMTTNERRQFIDYIREYNKSDPNNFISFLIITPEISNKDNLRKSLTDIKSETGIDISIIRASELKEFAEKSNQSKTTPTMKPFYHTRILNSKFLETLL